MNVFPYILYLRYLPVSLALLKMERTLGYWSPISKSIHPFPTFLTTPWLVTFYHEKYCFWQRGQMWMFLSSSMYLHLMFMSSLYPSPLMDMSWHYIINLLTTFPFITLSLVKWRSEIVSLVTFLPDKVLWKLSETITVLFDDSPLNISLPLGPKIDQRNCANVCHMQKWISNM